MPNFTHPVTLSSGQRQAVSLIRTLYLSRDILIINEASSHLDKKTEGRFLTLLKFQFPDLTVFLVSHRNAGDSWLTSNFVLKTVEFLS